MKWIYVLLLLVVGIKLTTKTEYLPLPVLIGALLVLMLIFLIRLYKLNREKGATARQVSGLQRVSSSIIYVSGMSAIVAILFMVLNIGNFGRPLLNFSLVLLMIGVVVGIFVPITASNDKLTSNERRNTIITRWIMNTVVICSITGMLFRLNDDPGSRVLMFGSLILAIITLVFLGLARKMASKQ